MVSLLSPSDEHECGGVLVAKDVVLSAAHCSGTADGKPMSIAHVARWNTLLFGSGDVYDEIRIKKEYIHPRFKYDLNDLEFDFMLLQLQQNSTYQPVRLNDKFFIPNTNNKLTTIGFGHTVPDDTSSTSSALQEVDLNYIPNNICKESNDGKSSYENGIKPSMMCATAPGKDACFGDSGGPLILRKENSNVNEDVVLGITSWGIRCADPDFPGVWARTSDQIEWLQDMICQISTDPPTQYYDCPTYGSDGDVPLVVKIQLDDHPHENSWKLTCNNGVVYGQAPLGTYGTQKGEIVEETVFVPAGTTCEFKIKDTFGDGLCCDSPGSFDVYLSYEPGTILASGGDRFGSELSRSFFIPLDAPKDDGNDNGEVTIEEGQTPLTVVIKLDDFPNEISWQVNRIGVDNETIFSVNRGTYRNPGETIVQTLALDEREIYNFKVTDAERDGIKDGFVQVLLGTTVPDTSDTEHTIMFLGAKGGKLLGSRDITFLSSSLLEGNENEFITLELRLGFYPNEIGFQLRVRDVIETASRSSSKDEGQVVFFRAPGFYANQGEKTVYEKIQLPKLVPGMQREFIFIITDYFGDGLCCHGGVQGDVIPGYSLYEGDASSGDLILTSKMKDTDREVQYFTLPSEQLFPVDPPTSAPTVLQPTSTDTLNIKISLSYNGDSSVGNSRFYIEDVITGERMATYPCSSNDDRAQTYGLPSGAYRLTLEPCAKAVILQGQVNYQVSLLGVNPNRPPLLDGSGYGSEGFMLVGDVSTIPLSVEFTTGGNPAPFNYYIKRLDIIEADTYLTQVAKFTMQPNQLYIHALSLQEGGLYRIAFEDVTDECLQGSELTLNIGKQSYPIKFPGRLESENRHIKFLAGALPSVQADGPYLTLRLKYDQDPLDFEYVLLEIGGEEEETAVARSGTARTLPDNRIYAFGPMNETLISTLAMKEHIDILRLPSYSGDKRFTILLTDSGGDGLCCKQGDGGPVELFDGPISDNKLFFQDSFQGTSRVSYSFTRTGNPEPKSDARRTALTFSALWSPYLLYLTYYYNY